MQYKLINRISFLLFALGVVSSCWADPTSDLKAFLNTLETKTLQSDFVISVSEQVNQPMNYPGSITMRGKKFTLAMFDTEAAYDGKTLYVYSPSTDELSLSNPTEQELLDANPFLYAQALLKVCNITSRTNKDGSVTYTLTPKDQSKGIQRFVLRLNNTTQLPLSIEMKEGKKLTKLTLKQPKYITTTPVYKLNKPGAYVNDLR